MCQSKESTESVWEKCFVKLAKKLQWQTKMFAKKSQVLRPWSKKCVEKMFKSTLKTVKLRGYKKFLSSRPDSGREDPLMINILNSQQRKMLKLLKKLT